MPLVTLLAGTGCASLGGAMTAVAIPWFVLATTGSGSRTGLVAATEAVGLLVSVALSGPWTDRHGPRRVSMLTDGVTAVAVAAIPTACLTVGLSLPALLTLAFTVGLGRSPARNAKTVLLPQAMATSGIRTERATSALETTINLGTMLGAPLGGLLITFVAP